MRAILDASVAIPLVHPEVLSPAIRRWVMRWTIAGGRVVVPRQFWFEVVNALAIGNGYAGSAVTEAVHQLRELPIETSDVDDATLLLVIDIVERYRLTAYDALYLAMAEQLDLPLVTMDRPLASAAGSRRIDPTAESTGLSEASAPYGTSARVSWPDYSGAASFLASMRADLKRRDAAARRI